MAGEPDMLRRVLDRWELHDLVAGYALAVDDHDLDALLALFSPQVRFTRNGVEFSGLDELRAFFVETFERYTLMLHMPYLQTIAWAGADGATGRVGSTAQLWIDGELVQAAFRYDDEYVRSDAGWRFVTRELSFLYAIPVAELGHRLDDDRRLRWPGREPGRAAYPETLPTWRSYRIPTGTSDGR